jgi:regulation of enolase protein 1 (concanavalin A-like superfamily)
VAAGAEATLTTAFTLAPVAQFDQAGMMVVVDDRTWVRPSGAIVDARHSLESEPPFIRNETCLTWSSQPFLPV